MFRRDAQAADMIYSEQVQAEASQAAEETSAEESDEALETVEE